MRGLRNRDGQGVVDYGDQDRKHTSLVGAVVARIAALVLNKQWTKERPLEEGPPAGGTICTIYHHTERVSLSSG